MPQDSDSEDDVPLGARVAARAKQTETDAVMKNDDSEDEDFVGDSEDEEPLNKRKAIAKKPPVKMAPAAKSPKPNPVNENNNKKLFWETLSHSGVLFPPPYEPHGVKLIYDGRPVDLTPAEEEVAGFFAVMKDTDYAGKAVFVKNFWTDFQRILTPKSKAIVKDFKKCDWTPMYNYFFEQREKKKQMTKEEKLQIKAQKEVEEEPFTHAMIDGKKEKVGNFRVEPPGLFRGRGEHPKMGKLKERIKPKDVIINIGRDSPVPACPIPGEKWGEVRHDRTVTWLAGWKDTINTKDWKYVQFAATSSIKGESDQKKYEKARKLKDFIERIRKDYRAKMKDADNKIAQMATATYLIDKLALRAGGEKDEDLADTVGCCTLRVGHVTLIPPHTIHFDFLGKDSIRYDQSHEVDPVAYKSFGRFMEGKKDEMDIFDKINPTEVNSHLQELMPGLTIKVFRTYNASITLSRLLKETPEGTVAQKKSHYDSANKEVAILCNHQKGESKAHAGQMQKLTEKKDQMEAELKELQKEKPMSAKTENKIRGLKERLSKHMLSMSMKEELKTVSLGTSKINYLDPRITVAWCKRNEVPLATVYPKTLVEKFNWAMEVEPEFDF
ncbi:DNA topoisomerase 1 [Cymbomonas tetramitiformis]|uniref:DNA topoisomerase I n=1 Tax=Cymbomonas tetramitiformis TaxID=36881 RepID=A0AAE0GIM7_9CHLO|nr:DNA topoisomerase 1 [Cymbomonas tetramitiformis]